MNDLIDDPAPGQNAPEFSVTEISGAVKRVIEGEFGRVRVRGELGRVARPRSGHLYLDLKDDRAVLSAVIWKGVAARLRTPPEEGMEVVATGRLTTFAGQSRYQMIIEELAPAGAGALMAMLEKRKAALAAEGLFAAERKRALPYLPAVIGVVTSPSGAVIRDILHRLRDRFPSHVVIWPVAVQGARCAPEVAAAIRGFNALARDGGPVPRPDLLIVARGGGSIEDLWGFNEEIVVRAAAESAIPLISAVGHETDTTLIDLAADHRAPTPSAAAERAVPVRLELRGTLDALGTRLANAAGRGLLHRRQRLRDTARILPRPETLVGQAAQRLDQAAERLPAALRAATQLKGMRLHGAAAGLRPQTLRRACRQQREQAARLAGRLAPATRRGIDRRRDALRHARQRLRNVAPDRRLGEQRSVCAALAQRLHGAMATTLEALRARRDGLERLRQTLGYQETLRRGFAVVRGDGAVATSLAAARAATTLEIEFHDGRLRAVPGPEARRKRRAPEPGTSGSDPDAPDQGRLF